MEISNPVISNLVINNPVISNPVIDPTKSSVKFRTQARLTESKMAQVSVHVAVRGYPSVEHAGLLMHR